MATRNRMRGQQANQPFDKEESFLGGVIKKRTRKPKANTRGAVGNLAAAGSEKARREVKKDRDTKRFEKDAKDLAAANIRLNKAEKNKRVKSKDGKSDRPSEASMRDSRNQRLALLKADTEAANKPPKKKTPPKVKMDVTPPKPKPKVTPKPVPRVYARPPGVGSRIKTALLGKDQKFGGDRGLIDFLPGKSRKKKSATSTAKSAAKSGASKTATTSRAKVTGKDKKDGSMRRNVGKGDSLRANVTKEQLQRLNLPVNNAGLKKYLDFMDKNNRRPTKADKLTLNKNMGGMAMKSKMASKGGKRGGKKMPGGMKGGGMASKGGARGGKKFPDMTGDGRVTQKDILKARGVPGFSKGDLVVNMVRELSKLGRRAFEKQYGKTALNKAIKETNKASGLTPTKAKKTPTQKKLAEADRRAEETKFTRQTPAAKKQRQVKANEKRIERMKGGGMAKKGYAKGGPVRSKMSAKGGKRGGASRKPRGVGVALRGYGKALK